MPRLLGHPPPVSGRFRAELFEILTLVQLKKLGSKFPVGGVPLPRRKPCAVCTRQPQRRASPCFPPFLQPVPAMQAPAAPAPRPRTLLTCLSPLPYHHHHHPSRSRSSW